MPSINCALGGASLPVPRPQGPPLAWPCLAAFFTVGFLLTELCFSSVQTSGCRISIQRIFKLYETITCREFFYVLEIRHGLSKQRTLPSRRCNKTWGEYSYPVLQKTVFNPLYIYYYKWVRKKYRYFKRKLKMAMT